MVVRAARPVLVLLMSAGLWHGAAAQPIASSSGPAASRHAALASVAKLCSADYARLCPPDPSGTPSAQAEAICLRPLTRESCSVFLSRLIQDAARHPEPESEDLEMLCLRAVMWDPGLSRKVRAQAAALCQLLEPSYMQSCDNRAPVTVANSL